jgi:tetratricopeptide (TPR) repeat protein
MRRRLDPGSPELAQSLVVHGRMLWKAGDYEKSRRQLEDAVAILRKEAPSSVLYSAYLNLATLSRLEGKLGSARQALDDAQQVGTSALPADQPVWYGLHLEYGEVLALLGERLAARTRYERALDLRTKAMGADHYDVGRVLAALGRLDLLDGDPRAARDRIERALRILEGQLSAASTLATSRPRKRSPRPTMLSSSISPPSIEPSTPSARGSSSSARRLWCFPSVRRSRKRAGRAKRVTWRSPWRSTPRALPTGASLPTTA